MKPISFSELLDMITTGEISKTDLENLRPRIDDYMRLMQQTTSEIKFVLETNKLYLDEYSSNSYIEDWMHSTISCSGYDSIYDYPYWANRRKNKYGDLEFYSFDKDN